MEISSSDWRTQLCSDSRQRIVNEITETLKRHLPESSGVEGILEHEKYAARFEEKTYGAATTQADYLRKISLVMLTMENNGVPNSLLSNSAASNQSPDPASDSMQLQVKQGETPISLPNQSQGREQLLSKSMKNTVASAGVPISAGLTSTSPTGFSQTTMPTDVGQSSISQGSHSNQSQLNQEPPVSLQPQGQQQKLSQSIQETIASGGVQSTASLASTLPCVTGHTEPSMPNAVGQSSNVLASHNMQSQLNKGQSPIPSQSQKMQQLFPQSTQIPILPARVQSPVSSKSDLPSATTGLSQTTMQNDAGASSNLQGSFGISQSPMHDGQYFEAIDYMDPSVYACTSQYMYEYPQMHYQYPYVSPYMQAYPPMHYQMQPLPYCGHVYATRLQSTVPLPFLSAQQSSQESSGLLQPQQQKKSQPNQLVGQQQSNGTSVQPNLSSIQQQQIGHPYRPFYNIANLQQHLGTYGDSGLQQQQPQQLLGTQSSLSDQATHIPLSGKSGKGAGQQQQTPQISSSIWKPLQGELQSQPQLFFTIPRTRVSQRRQMLEHLDTENVRLSAENARLTTENVRLTMENLDYQTQLKCLKDQIQSLKVDTDLPLKPIESQQNTPLAPYHSIGMLSPRTQREETCSFRRRLQRYLETNTPTESSKDVTDGFKNSEYKEDLPSLITKWHEADDSFSVLSPSAWETNEPFIRDISPIPWEMEIDDIFFKDLSSSVQGR
ncbi:hypothetical protein GIB67_016961 [Kingdonia uniflora]|uniref:Mediator complex subunit 15 KIX domain-containing protein n=1 Tax=Kingdonia uniflora TaxID=39325 RepID=A0A7J7M3G9_9MAGN|nr:hypothetical protein GIB67_016961 [Kingdonia uniflora]